MKDLKYHILRWLTAWANLLDSIIAVVSFGTIWTFFGGRAIAKQVKYEMNSYKNKEYKSDYEKWLNDLTPEDRQHYDIFGELRDPRGE